MELSKLVRPILLLTTFSIVCFTMKQIEAKPLAKGTLDSALEYMNYSEGYYDLQSGISYAGQCHSNEKASEMMAVSKLSKFLSGSTITAEEFTSLNSTYNQKVTSSTKSFRPDYMVISNDNFDGYYCTLVATKD